MTNTLLAQDKYSNVIQALKPSVVQNVSFTTTPSAKTTNNLSSKTVVVRLLATTDCYVEIGPADTVVASSASMYLPALLPEYIRVDQSASTKIAALAVSSSGVLNVTEMT